MLTELNFPLFEFRMERKEDKLMIFDPLRKKWISLTPEEWVRQHMIRFLIEYKGYPRSLIRVESGLKYDKLRKRSDILVFDTSGDPYLVIECKGPEVDLDRKAIHQVAAYSKALRVKYIGISNGIKHFCWAVNHSSATTQVLTDFPDYV